MNENEVINYDIRQIADIMGASTKWVRAQVNAGAEHQRIGNRIKMNARQIKALQERNTVSPAPAVKQPMTTTRKKRS